MGLVGVGVDDGFSDCLFEYFGDDCDQKIEHNDNHDHCLCKPDEPNQADEKGVYRAFDLHDFFTIWLFDFLEPISIIRG